MESMWLPLPTPDPKGLVRAYIWPGGHLSSEVDSKVNCADMLYSVMPVVDLSEEMPGASFWLIAPSL